MKNLSLLFLACWFCLPFTVFSQNGSDVKKSLSAAAVQLQTGNFAEAEKILLTAQKLAPANSDVHNLLGIIYDQKSDFKQAEISYRNAIRLNPKTVSPLANLAVLLAKTKREKEAIAIFERVLKINPNHPQTIINLGFLYRSTGNFHRAADFLRKANLLQPNSNDILFQLGTALYQIKNLSEAKNIFRQLNTAEASYYLGLIEFDQNQNDSAWTNFENALILKPNFADANFMLGEIAVKKSSYRVAKDYYEKAIRLDNSKAVYFIRLGGSLLYQNEFYKATEVFQNASLQFPQVPEIFYFLATSQKLTGLLDPALHSLEKSLNLKPSYADALILTGAILIDKNEFVKAEKYLRQGIALSPNNFNANHDLGRLLVKQQKYTEALPLLQKASSLTSTIPDVYYQLYLTYSRLKRQSEANEALRTFKILLEKEKKQ